LLLASRSTPPITFSIVTIVIVIFSLSSFSLLSLSSISLLSSSRLVAAAAAGVLLSIYTTVVPSNKPDVFAAFGRISDAVEAIGTPETYKQCEATCSEQLQGALVSPTTRFTRQLVFSMLRTHAFRAKQTLDKARLHAWAGAFRSPATYQDASWRWRRTGQVFVANSTASGWLEAGPGGGPGASAWAEPRAGGVQAEEMVSTVGQAAALNSTAEPGCMAADPLEPGFVKAAVLYPWLTNASSMHLCACEIPSACPSLQICRSGLAHPLVWWAKRRVEERTSYHP
jgi:hypothetical protein